MNKMFYIIALITGIICFPKSGFCYLDPGTGSFILQMLAAVFLGALFVIKMYWQKIKGFFGKKKDVKDPE